MSLSTAEAWDSSNARQVCLSKWVVVWRQRGWESSQLWPSTRRVSGAAVGRSDHSVSLFSKASLTYALRIISRPYRNSARYGCSKPSKCRRDVTVLCTVVPCPMVSRQPPRCHPRSAVLWHLFYCAPPLALADEGGRALAAVFGRPMGPRPDALPGISTAELWGRRRHGASDAMEVWQLKCRMVL